MNALTRISADTPVKFDVMNKLETEIEARDIDLQEQINDLIGSSLQVIKTNYSISASTSQEITCDRGIWLITIEATGLTASEFMYTGILSFVNQYAENLAQIGRLDFGSGASVTVTATANGFTISNGTASTGTFKVRRVLLQ